MNERGKSIDNTHLSIDMAEKRGFIHRDYIAHCLRWSHVMKHLGKKALYRTIDILDIGCGKEVPLAKTMYSSRFIPTSGSYTGIDVNRLEVPEMFSSGKFPIKLIGNTDVCEYRQFGRQFGLITCFEVLEHVEPEHSFRMLKTIREQLTNNGTAFISTPCYDAGTGAAANHVNEMSFPGLYYMIDRACFKINNIYGTFASQRDIEPHLSPAQRVVYEGLKEYYDSNYVATLMAPLFPALSRNCLWELELHQDSTAAFESNYSIRNMTKYNLDAVDMGASKVVEAKHSSSHKWSEFIRSIT